MVRKSKTNAFTAGAKWVKYAACVLCILLCGCQSKPAQSEKEVSSAPVSSVASSKPVSSTVQPTSKTESEEPKDLPSIVDGRTIVAVGYDHYYWNNPVMLLTDDQKVLVCLDHEEGRPIIYRKELAEREDLFVQKDEHWGELILPEPIVDISGMAALGESGKVYVICYGAFNPISEEASSRSAGVEKLVTTDPVVTVQLDEPVRQIYGKLGDYFLVTESGKLYNIGNMAMYVRSDQKLDDSIPLKLQPLPACAIDFSTWTVPMKAEVPEPVVQVLSSPEVVCALGKSGKVYYSRVFNPYDFYNLVKYDGTEVDEKGNCIEVWSKQNCAVWDKWEMKPLGVEHIKQMGVGLRSYQWSPKDDVFDAADAIYFLSESGALTRFTADFLIRRTYDSVYTDAPRNISIARQTDMALSKALEKLGLGEKVTEIFQSNCVTFLTESGALYWDYNRDGAEKLDSNCSFCIPLFSEAQDFSNIKNGVKPEDCTALRLTAEGETLGKCPYTESIRIQRPNF